MNIPEEAIIGIYDGELRQYEIEDDRMVDNDQHKYIVQIAREGDVLFAPAAYNDAPFDGIDYLNHSCGPNVSVRDQIVLVADRP